MFDKDAELQAAAETISHLKAILTDGVFVHRWSLATSGSIVLIRHPAVDELLLAIVANPLQFSPGAGMTFAIIAGESKGRMVRQEEIGDEPAVVLNEAYNITLEKLVMRSVHESQTIPGDVYGVQHDDRDDVALVCYVGTQSIRHNMRAVILVGPMAGQTVFPNKYFHIGQLGITCRSKLS